MVRQVAEEAVGKDQHRLGLHVRHGGMGACDGEDLDVARRPVAPPDDAMRAHLVDADALVRQRE